MKKSKLNLLVLSVSAILVTACGGGSAIGSKALVSHPIAPAIKLSFAVPKATVGTPVVLSWSSTNAVSCTGSDGLAGSLLTTSSAKITPTVGGVAKYTVSCTGAGGSTSKTVELVTPIPVQRTSYLNYKTINRPESKHPFSPNYIAGEAITSGHAYGDFFQNGTISMIAASNVFDRSDNTLTGKNQKIYFFQKDSTGTWIDKTSTLLSAADRTGCISPRQISVADFNGDKKPDAFIACHGIDGEIPTGYTIGEKPRYLLSQPDGTYKNVQLNFICYCHGSAAVDFNGDGFADVVVASPPVIGRVAYLKNNRDGTFTDTPSLIPASTFNKSIWTVDLLDVNGDGKIDLFVAGSENVTGPTGVSGQHPWDVQPTFFINDGTNFFSDKLQKQKLPFSNLTGVSDVIIGAGKIAFYRGAAFTGDTAKVQIMSYPDFVQTKLVQVGKEDTPFFNLYNGNIVGTWDYNAYVVTW